MKKIVIILTVVLIFCFLMIKCFGNASDNSNNDESSSNDYTNSVSDAWYIGGDLHKEKIFKWKLASNENKLATCADFIATVIKDKPIEDLKPIARELVDCIDEATRDLPETNSQKVSEVATLCIITLGYN